MTNLCPRSSRWLCALCCGARSACRCDVPCLAKHYPCLGCAPQPTVRDPYSVDSNSPNKWFASELYQGRAALLRSRGKRSCRQGMCARQLQSWVSGSLSVVCLGWSLSQTMVCILNARQGLSGWELGVNPQHSSMPPSQRSLRACRACRHKVPRCTTCHRLSADR